MQYSLTYIFILRLVFVCTTIAKDIPASQQGSFKVAITRREDDDSAPFKSTYSKSGTAFRARDQSFPVNVATSEDVLHSKVAQSESVNSGTAKVDLQTKVVNDGTFQVINYATIQIGTPPQDLIVDIDTIKSDFWVLTGKCPTCSEQQFNKTASDSYEEDEGTKYDIVYGGRTVSAVLASDVVAVQGLSLKKQPFGAVASESDEFSEIPNRGVLGLAFSSVTSKSKASTFFENLVTQDILAEPIFSVHLARDSKTGSEICFGCLDKEKTTGLPSWIPLLYGKKNYWSVNLSRLIVGDKSIAPSVITAAAMQTGGSFIFVPRNLAEQFYAMIPNSRPITGRKGYFEYPCNDTQIVSIELGDAEKFEFPLNMADFNLGSGYGNDVLYCAGGIRYRDGGPNNLVILGRVFLHSWYTTYDYSNLRVGISPSINNK